MLLTAFKKAEWGLLLLIALIPQPNIWYKFHSYPLGKNFIDMLYISIFVGIVVQGKKLVGKQNTFIIILFVFYSYISLWNCSMRYSLPLPVTLSNYLLYDFKNFAQMMFLYFMVMAVAETEEQQKILVVIMSVVILLIAVKSYRNFSGGAAFSYDKRVGGPFEAVGLGANHFGAFIAHYCSLLLGLFLFDKNKKRKYLFLTTVLFGLHPLFFAYSRGAYLAALAVVVFFGVFKKRSLLFLLIGFLIFWQFILPVSVVDRITMTKTETGEIEGSAAHRFTMWEIAFNLFYQNPVFGSGYGSYGFNVPDDEELKDTHNYYIRILCEQGILGFVLLLLLLTKALWSGRQLMKKAGTPFGQGLGMGFMGCVFATMITNLFGDRFSYFVLGSYFFIFWGIVDRMLLNLDANEKQVQAKISTELH